MSGIVPLLPLYSFMALTKTTLPFFIRFSTNIVRSCIIIITYLRQMRPDSVTVAGRLKLPIRREGT